MKARDSDTFPDINGLDDDYDDDDDDELVKGAAADTVDDMLAIAIGLLCCNHRRCHLL